MAGSAVFYGSKFRVPQFAAQTRFAPSSGKCRTLFLDRSHYLRAPFSTSAPGISVSHSSLFILWPWNPSSGRCATSVRTGFLPPFPSPPGGVRLACRLLSPSTARARLESTMSKGILYDATMCIGCKQCEQACATENGLPYDDKIAAQNVTSAL